MSDEDLLLVHRQHLLLCPHLEEAGRELSGVSFYNDTNPILRLHPHHLRPASTIPLGSGHNMIIGGTHTFNSQRTFSAPTSFLIQPEGQVAVNSKGP